MEKEVLNIKKEIQKVSLDFRTIASRLLSTKYEEGMNNLKRFVNHIENTPVIYEFVKSKKCQDDQIKKLNSILNSEFTGIRYDVPDDCQDEEIAYIYHLLKLGLKNFYTENNDYDYGYFDIARRWRINYSNCQACVDRFNHDIVKNFINYISNHLTQLVIDCNDDDRERTSVYLHGNNHTNYVGKTTMSTEAKYNFQNAQFGGGFAEKVEGDQVGGNIHNYASKASLTEAAVEIRKLLQELEQSYPTKTTAEKMMVAAKAVECIENDPSMKQRAINAVKEGGLKAFEKAIDHPLGAFVTGAVQGWQDTEAE